MRVDFSLDGVFVRRETVAPYDFAGTANGNQSSTDPANPWVTTGVANGSHTIAKATYYSDGTRVSSSATVRIANGQSTPTPVPTRTPGPTGTPAPARTPTPPPAPAGTSCTNTLQSLINAAASGSTLTVPACVYRESVTVSKPLVINGFGAVIDGRDTAGTARRGLWMTVSASNVTIAGFTMRYANNLVQTGALRIGPTVSGVTIKDCDLSFAGGAAVQYGDANSSTVQNCAIHDNAELGIHLGGDGVNGRNNTLRCSHIYNNNTAGYTAENEAGGIKATVQAGLVIDGNEIDHNTGPGFGCDIYCANIVVSNNRVHHNTHAGIMFEVHTGAKIFSNVSYSNGSLKAVWGWGAGVLISSSGGAEVYGNVLAWNTRSGVWVISRQRFDWPNAQPTNNYVHDNVTVSLPDTWLMFWGSDWSATPMYLAASNNRGANNRYWMGYPEDGRWRFAWTTNLGSLSAFNATPGEESGRTYRTRTATRSSPRTASRSPLEETDRARRVSARLHTMGFEVPPTPVSGRSTVPVLAGLAVTAGLLLVAFVLAGQDRLVRPAGPAVPGTAASQPAASQPAASQPGAAARPSAAAIAAHGPMPSPTGGSAAPGALPAVPDGIVRCHRVASAACLRVARSAAALIAGDSPGAVTPGIAGVDVWASLLCGDNLDCPLDTLRRLDPIGSAAVSLAGDAGQVWVNVGERSASRGDAGARRPLEAWIVRWFH